MLGAIRLVALGFVFLVFGIGLLFIGISGSVSADGGNNTSVEPAGEIIDENTELVSAEYDGDGTAIIEVKSQRPQTISVNDAGAFIVGGEVESRSVTVRPGEVAEIRLPVVEADGFVGVGITTGDDVGYAVPLREPTPADQADNPFSGTGPTTGWLGGASVVAFGVVGAAVQQLRKKPDKPRRSV